MERAPFSCSRRLALAATLVLLGAAVTARASGNGIGETRDEEAVGHSEPNSKSAADAQHGAEEDALRAAVETAAKELMGDKAEQDKAAVVKDKILKNARRYVTQFRVLDRSAAGGTVIEKVRATVSVDLLKSDLVAAGLLAAEGPTTSLTRVVVLPAPSKSGTPPWWAQGGAANAPDPLTMTMVTALRARGFDVIEPRRPEADPNATATPTPGPTPDMAKDNVVSVAKSYAVDLAVKVPWETQVTIKSLDGISYALAHAKVGPVEAIAVRDGNDVTSVDGEGVAGEVLDPVRAKTGTVPSDVAQRISDAALKDAADDASVHLTAALGDPVSKSGASTTIQLVVAGLDSYVAYARFDGALQHELKTIRGASLHAMERGEATYELSLDKNADAAAVADELSKHDFTDFSVKVTEKTPARVVVHVQR